MNEGRESLFADGRVSVARTAPDGPIHTIFGLSYADVLVLPRVLLQSMPLEWQERFVAAMNEYNHHWRALPDGFAPARYRVQPVDADGKFESWGDYRLPGYDRGRTLVTIEGGEA